MDNASEAARLANALLSDLPSHFERARFRRVYQEAAEQTVRNTSPLRERGYRLRHGHRVACLGFRLLQDPEVARRSLDAQSETVVWLGGLLHDVTKGNPGPDPPGTDHAAEARRYLHERLHGLWDPEVIERVGEVVFLHNKRERAAPIEARIVQDADLLDHFGALEIWLAAYASAGCRESLETCLDYLGGPEYRRWRAYAKAHAFFAVTRQALDERMAVADRLIRRLRREAVGELRLDPL